MQGQEIPTALIIFLVLYAGAVSRYGIKLATKAGVSLLGLLLTIFLLLQLIPKT